MSQYFGATWVSHSSIADYLRCPRSYYLNNVYKDPKTGHKIQLMSPALALGQAVHEALESISQIPVDRRFDTPLIDRFDKAWQKITGQRGGFQSESHEAEYRSRGEDMIKRVAMHPGPLKQQAVKIADDLPKYLLSESDNIILCGKVDWLWYQPDTDSVHIIDFKTGRNEESDESLQLPIYYLLVSNTQRYTVSGASYWYLAHSNELTEQSLPDLQESQDRVLAIAKKIHVQKKLNNFKCPDGESGCRYCRPLERIVNGEGTFVGVSSYNQDVYILRHADTAPKQSEKIL